MPPITKCCKTCAHWNLRGAMGPSGKRMVRVNPAALCQCPVERPVFPESATIRYDFERHWKCLTEDRYMRPTDGTECPCWKLRED